MQLCFNFYYLTDSYSWIITDPSLLNQIKTAKPRDGWKSPVFPLYGFQWYLKVYPNGSTSKEKGWVQIYFKLANSVLPPKVKQLFTIFEITEQETNTQSVFHYTYRNSHLSWGGTHNLKTAEIENHNRLIFTANIQSLTAFDDNGDDVTEKYHKTKINAISQSHEQQLTEKLNSLTSKMDELVKIVKGMQKRMDDIELKIESKDDEFKAMKQELRRLTSSNDINPERRKLKIWLEDKVKLPQYYAIFINNGIDDLSTARLLTMEGLKGMGIDIVGHQMKILSQVVKLSQSS